MNANAVKIFPPAGNAHFAMQQPPVFKTVRRNVNVIPTDDGVTAENCIAVVPFVVHGIFSIGEVRPDRICQELVLGIAWPLLEALSMSLMLADYFLQKNDVGIESAQTVA